MLAHTKIVQPDRFFHGFYLFISLLLIKTK